MSNQQSLIQRVKDGSQEFDLLGWIVWWNIRNVEISQDEFKQVLSDANIDTSYARTHNYRSALTRALKSMEDKRIIRQLEETGYFWKIQFTAESRVLGDEGNELSYDKETIVVINKKTYQETKDFSKSLVEGKEEIKQKLIELFEVEQHRYNSSDITRYIQNIFRDNADMVSLREQGAVYFVPSNFQAIMDSISQIVSSLGSGSSFCCMPMIDTDSVRNVVGGAFNEELEGLIGKLNTEIDGADGEASAKWKDHRIETVTKLVGRLEIYSDILENKRVKELTEGLERAKKEVLGLRVLDLE